MRILVFGGTGMLGHKLAQVFGSTSEVAVAIRGDSGRWPRAIPVARVFSGMDSRDSASVASALDAWKPDAVLNAAGVIKQIAESHDPLQMMRTNAIFPNVLAALCEERGIRLVHYSTDCVFTGSRESIRGPEGYRETDRPDSRDPYGMSKLLGEPGAGTTVVLRTSMIGREIRGHSSLLEWFLAQGAGPVKGFTNAFFTGLTTPELARVTALVLNDRPGMTGLWHVSAPAITKYDLLRLAAKAFGRQTTIEESSDFFCDRRLDGSRFAHATGWQCPSWPELMEDVRNDPYDYDRSAAQFTETLT